MQVAIDFARALPGEVEDVAFLDVGDEVGDRRRGRRQVDAQRREPLVRRSRHTALGLMVQTVHAISCQFLCSVMVQR
ncbi:hypothetical protein D3C72_2382560 [compost metagenome]